MQVKPLGWKNKNNSKAWQIFIKTLQWDLKAQQILVKILQGVWGVLSDFDTIILPWVQLIGEMFWLPISMEILWYMFGQTTCTFVALIGQPQIQDSLWQQVNPNLILKI